MPRSPVGRDGKDHADLPAVGVAPPAVRRGEVAHPDSEPIAVTPRGPAYSGDAGAGSSGKEALVPAQVRRFS